MAAIEQLPLPMEVPIKRPRHDKSLIWLMAAEPDWLRLNSSRRIFLESQTAKNALEPGDVILLRGQGNSFDILVSEEERPNAAVLADQLTESIAKGGSATSGSPKGFLSIAFTAGRPATASAWSDDSLLDTRTEFERLLSVATDTSCLSTAEKARNIERALPYLSTNSHASAVALMERSCAVALFKMWLQSRDPHILDRSQEHLFQAALQFQNARLDYQAARVRKDACALLEEATQPFLPGFDNFRDQKPAELGFRLQRISALPIILPNALTQAKQSGGGGPSGVFLKVGQLTLANRTLLSLVRGVCEDVQRLHIVASRQKDSLELKVGVFDEFAILATNGRRVRLTSRARQVNLQSDTIDFQLRRPRSASATHRFSTRLSEKRIISHHRVVASALTCNGGHARLAFELPSRLCSTRIYF